MVLASSSYPENFPQHAKVAYVPESKQLVVEYDLPAFEAIPTVGSYKYIKTKDTITETARPATQRKALYSSVVAQIALRTLYELFKADRNGFLDIIVLNGYVDTIDKGTGHATRICLITVRTSRDTFMRLDLSKVDPIECLKVLNASVSKSPTELVPVRPVLEFNMVDPRFIEETDILSELDQRPNLMDLSPSEFEALITNLFQKMGYETRLTRSSRDGGVDCVAYKLDSIIRVKVVIQAKRYKDTVGVSAVRDLYGTVMNEGASQGILITTSGFGKASFEFAENKPLDLFSGSQLLALLAEHAGIEAKIEMPND
jgi:restriction system protein